MILPLLLCAAPVAIDGDTIKGCGPEPVRLLGIDAPELPHHCRRGRVCAPGDPYASADNLRRLLHGRVTVEPLKHDRYGRIVGIVRANGVNASCAQLRGGYARYVDKWDEGHRIARECAEVAS